MYIVTIAIIILVFYGVKKFRFMMYKGEIIRFLVEKHGMDKTNAARIVNLNESDVQRLYKKNQKGEDLADHIITNLT